MSEGLKGRLEIWDISKIIPYENNTKDHPPEQIEKLARQIAVGWDQPLVLDKDGVIIKGHGRRLAALHLGIETVPVLIRDDLTPKQVKAARVADNQIATLGSLDMDALSREIQALMESSADDIDIDISDLGFNAEDFVFETVNDESSFMPTAATNDNQQNDPQDPIAQPKDYSKPDLSQEQEFRELRQIIVDCANEKEQELVFNMITDAGYTCRPLTL